MAKNATLIGVKVATAQGFVLSTNLLDGLDWVLNATTKSGRPSVVNLSLGGEGKDETLDTAVGALIQAGVHVVQAVGNSGVSSTVLL